MRDKKFKKIWKCLGAATIAPIIFTASCCLSSCQSKEEPTLDNIKIVSELTNLEVNLGQSLKSSPIIAKGYDKEGNELDDLSLQIVLSNETGQELPDWITIDENNQICIGSLNEPGIWNIHVQVIDLNSSIKSDFQSFKVVVIDPSSIPDSLEIDCPDSIYVLAPTFDHLPIGLIAYKNGKISYECNKNSAWKIKSIEPLNKNGVNVSFQLEDVGAASMLYTTVLPGPELFGNFNINIEATSLTNPKVIVTKTILIKVVCGYEYTDPKNNYYYQRVNEKGQTWKLSSIPENTIEIINVKDEIYDVPVTEVQDNFLPSSQSKTNIVYKVTLPESITRIGDYAFYQQQKIMTILMPGVKEVGESAFRDCEILQFSSLGDKPNLTSVGAYAFYNCQSLIFDTVQSPTTIGEYAFWKTDIRKLTFDSDIETIGAYAFADCPKLTSVTFNDLTPAVCTGNIFANYADGLKIYVPAIAKNDYLKADVWKQYSDRIYTI